MARSSWLLLLLLVACGRTDHDPHVSATGGDETGGSSPVTMTGGGASSNGGASSDGGAGGLTQHSCLYPIEGLAPISNPPTS